MEAWNKEVFRGGSMIRFVKLHIMGVKIAFASRMVYRADFLLSSFITLLGDLIIPLITFLIYTSGASFPGWNIYEVLLIQGIFMISRGIANMFFFGTVWNTLSSVREGTFDLILLRPHSTLHMTMITAISCDDLGVIAGGILISGIALYNLPAPGIINILGFIFFFIVSLMVLVSFAIIMSATVFKWVGNSRVYEIFDAITIFGQYPATIFSKGFNILVTWVIPITMIAFIPASVLLGKAARGIYIAALSSVVLFVMSLVIWHLMQKKYTSVGG